MLSVSAPERIDCPNMIRQKNRRPKRPYRIEGYGECPMQVARSGPPRIPAVFIKINRCCNARKGNKKDIATEKVW
jgi:hypothetical protein